MHFNKKRLFILFCVFTTFNLFAESQEAYKYAETNGIATVICAGIKFMRTAIIPIAGIMLSVTGLAAFQGKINFLSLLTLAVGIGIFRNTSPLLKMISPDTDLHYECKCIPKKKVLRRYTDSEGNKIWQEIIIDTGVDEDCNPI